MKKLFLLLFLAGTIFGLWKYLHKPARKPILPEQALDAAGSYVPSMIETKKRAEQKINNSAQMESDRLQESLKEIN